MEWRTNPCSMLLGEMETMMKRYTLTSFIALSSVFVFAQSLKSETVSGSCKRENLYENNDYAKKETIVLFLTELQYAIKEGDKPRVAKLVHYPLSVQTTNAEFNIASQKEFIKQYDRILPIELKSFLLKQQPQCVSRVGAKGFSIGSGQLWFDEYPDGEVRIFAINAIVYPGE